MLPKKYRLPAKAFRNVYTRGLKFRGQYGMLVATPSQSLRIGFVINKKIGNAIKRHRMTRLLRVSFLELVKELNIENRPLDLEYVAFEFCDSKETLKVEFEKQIKQAFSL